MSNENAPKGTVPYFIGVDLGGTGMKIGIMDDQGKTIHYLSAPTQVERGPEDAVKRMAGHIHRAIEEARIPKNEIVRIGLGSAGPIDIPAGKFIRPTNLPGWDFFPICERLAAESGYPVTFANDASAAAFAEYWVGAGQNEPGLIVLTLGTGVGCGLILNGRPWSGIHSHGGEAAHILVDISENARWCNCGQQGHFEAYAGALGVAKRTKEMMVVKRDSSLKPRVRDAERLSDIPKIVFEEAEKGDALAVEIIQETARWLAYGIVSLVHTLDPSCVLLGGAMTFGGHNSPIGKMFLRQTTEEVKKRIFQHLAERIRIDFAQLGGDAGYIGAAGLARQDYHQIEFRVAQ